METGGWMVETKRKYLNYVTKVKNRSKKEGLAKVFGC
jgi:hypothetical protein